MNVRGQGLFARAWAACGVAAILLSALWVYRPVLHGGWLWDDDLEVAGNPVLREAAGWWKPWVAPAGMDYFPLKSTLQWLEWHLWGGRVEGYHLANLALHGLSALLVWRLLGKLLGPTGGLGAWLGGFLFAIHPVAVESVAWISEFKNVLSLPPLLLAMIAWVDWEGRADPQGPPGSPVGPAGPAAPPYLGGYLQSLLWFLIAMLCKTTVVMLPVVLLLQAWWRRGRIGWIDLRRTLPFFAVSVVLGVVTVCFQRHRAIGIAGPMPEIGARLAQAGWSALAYLRECLWPSGLAAIYLPAGSGWPAAVPWLVLAALFAALWSRRKSWGRHVLFGLGWFFLNLAPVLGLIPMSYLRIAPRADHFAYLPLIGLTGLAGAALAAARAVCPRRSCSHLPQGGPSPSVGRSPPLLRRAPLGQMRTRPPREVVRGLLVAAVAAICAALALASHSYAAVFRSQETLWTAAVGRSPGAWLACNNLGRERLRQGRLPEARSLFEEAIRQGPGSAEVHANLGAVYERMGRAAEARAQYEESLRLDPGFAGGHYNLGNLLLAAGEPDRAADEFRAALRIDPASAPAHNNFGLALARQGKGGEAMEQYRAALRLDPNLADAWVNLGNALFRLGRLGEAIHSYQAALAIAPENAAARHNLGAALERTGRPPSP